eukprot:1146539-Pelagomonas_calceolata.AAC.12
MQKWSLLEALACCMHDGELAMRAALTADILSVFTPAHKRKLQVKGSGSYGTICRCPACLASQPEQRLTEQAIKMAGDAPSGCSVYCVLRLKLLVHLLTLQSMSTEHLPMQDGAALEDTLHRMHDAFCHFFALHAQSRNGEEQPTPTSPLPWQQPSQLSTPRSSPQTGASWHKQGLSALETWKQGRKRAERKSVVGAVGRGAGRAAIMTNEACKGLGQEEEGEGGTS